MLANTYQTKIISSDVEKYTPPISKSALIVSPNKISLIIEVLKSLTLTT